MFQPFSESICFKIEYLKSLEFHTRFDLFHSTFQQLFEVLGYSSVVTDERKCFKLLLKHIKQDVIIKDSIIVSLHQSFHGENNANCLIHTQFRFLWYLLIIPTLCFSLLEHSVFDALVIIFNSGT